LVTDWNPLTVWAYYDSYVRFAAQDYDPSSTNKYAHLTNNAIVKKFMQDEYGVEEDAEEDEEMEMDNIWSSVDFGGHLQKHFGHNFQG